MLTNNWGLVGSRRSAGGLTTLNYKGHTVIKQKRAKGQSNPSPQYLQSQAAYNLLLNIFQNVKTIIDQGYINKRRSPSNWNQFFTYNRDHAVDLSSPPNVTLEPANVLISKGSMTPTIFNTGPFATQAGNAIKIEANATILTSDQSMNDIAYVSVYNSNTGEWWGNTDQFINRVTSPEEIFIIAPPGLIITGNILYIYMSWIGINSSGIRIRTAGSTVSIVTAT